MPRHPSKDLHQACAAEPIHIPGCIQAYGVLLAFNRAHQATHISANAHQIFGVSAQSLLGKDLSDILGHSVDSPLYKDLTGLQNDEPEAFTAISLPKSRGQDVDITAHRVACTLVLEIEPHHRADGRTPSSEAPERHIMAWHAQVQRSIQRLQRAPDLSALSHTIAKEVQALLEVDRVMVYRFDKAWNGRVVAESCSEGVVKTYLGQNFPASDIPPQARAVFTRTWLRMIPDIDGCRPELLSADIEPLDMSRSHLRAPSPVHLEYLRNMGAQATLTISLLRDGALWGLIACHHHTPLYVPLFRRQGSELLGRMASSLLLAKEQAGEAARRAELMDTVQQLTLQMRQAASPAAGLLMGKKTLDALADSSPGSVAVLYEGVWHQRGDVPDKDFLNQFVRWLAEEHPDADVFTSEHLPLDYPPAKDKTSCAAGVLAINVSQISGACVLWFRPEILRTVAWAGNPFEKIEVVVKDPKTSTNAVELHPRKSFERWRETVSGCAAPFSLAEQEAVLSLRKNLIEVDLERQCKREREALADNQRLLREAQEASQARDHVLGVVSHDLRNPLGVVRLSTELVERRTKNFQIEEKAVLDRPLGKIKSACVRMERLIEDVLSLAKVDAGKLTVERQPTSAASLLSEAHNLLEPLAEAQSVRLNVAVDEKSPLTLLCDFERMMQVIGNLVGNAIKFTPPEGAVTLSLGEDDGRAVIAVEDTGQGIPEDELPYVFDRFWQAQRTARKGAGLGLAIAKGIVEAHGGAINVASQPSQGTRFWFTCPLA